MAKKNYTLLEQGVASQHAMFAGREEGDALELDLDHNTERAVVAAGWVEPVEETTTKKKREG